MRTKTSGECTCAYRVGGILETGKGDGIFDPTLANGPMHLKETSPFTPGSPVPVELFVGRKEQIQEAIRYIDRAAAGIQDNVFLVGERGIGKSSLASYLRSYAEIRKNVLGVHVFLGSVSALEEMVRYVLDALLRETRKQPFFDRVRGLFGNYIEQVDLFGISLRFSPPQKELEQLVRSFPEALRNIVDRVRNEKPALFLALDDVNGLAERAEFANWYKSFVDKVATGFGEFPVLVMLIGLPENRDTLFRLQPSLMRIFRVTEVEKLSDSEVEEFFSRAFGEAGLEVVPEAMMMMTRFASGLPILMHEIGDATFWADNDGSIGVDDAGRGVISAAESIGKKYLDPKVYRAIRSERYRSILRKLGQLEIPTRFTKREVEEKLTETEKRVFHNFLRKLRQLGIIEPDLDKARGSYRFVNEIYPVYIRMQSSEGQRKRRSRE